MTWAAGLDLTDADDAFRLRFWSKVQIGEPDECWEWLRYRKPSGYGQFTVRKGVFVTASRVSLALSTPIPAGMVACHRCDNPPCCNPSHIFLGSQVDNGLDSVSKGRAHRARGEASASAKLTPAAVAFIRSQDLSKHGRKSEIAREFGVSLTAVRRILARRTWAHVA